MIKNTEQLINFPDTCYDLFTLIWFLRTIMVLTLVNNGNVENQKVVSRGQIIWKKDHKEVNSGQIILSFENHKVVNTVSV